MKHKLFHIQSLLAVMLCVLMSATLAACGDDDDGDEPQVDNLSKVIVGAWAQDGDNDIFVVNADGTGVGYENAEDYKNGEVGYTFTWSYKDGWVYVNIDFYGSIQKEEMRAESFSQNKIVWKRYELDETDYSHYDKDAFGYYELWTWERYSK